LPLYVQDDAAVWYMQTLMQNYAIINTPIVYPPATTTAGLVTLRWLAAPFNYDAAKRLAGLVRRLVRIIR
jgi:hypothetical protein